MKLKIDSIYHSAAKRDGTPYVTRTGRRYELCTIVSNGQRYYGFGSQTTKSWKAGDEVEVVVSQENGFNRFRLPSKTVTRAEFDSLKRMVEILVERVESLERMVFKAEEVLNDQEDEASALDEE